MDIPSSFELFSSDSQEEWFKNYQEKVVNWRMKNSNEKKEMKHDVPTHKDYFIRYENIEMSRRISSGFFTIGTWKRKEVLLRTLIMENISIGLEDLIDKLVTLQHNNLGRVFGFTLLDGKNVALVEEFSSTCRNLEEYSDRRREKMDLEKMWSLTNQMITALQYLHSQSFYHRNLSLSDFMISGNRVYLTGLDCGSLKNNASSSDVFSIGCCIHRLVHGKEITIFENGDVSFPKEGSTIEFLQLNNLIQICLMKNQTSKSVKEWLQSQEFMKPIPKLNESWKDEMKDRLSCPLTLERFVDPVFLAETGVTYERKAILEWIDLHDSCPMTRITLVTKKIIPNYALKQVMEHSERLLK